MEEEREDIRKEIFEAENSKEECRMELRGMELKAYSSTMDALRADGGLDKEKRGVMESLKKYFNISEARHMAECRRVNATPKLCQMADRLKTSEHEEEDDTWITEGYDIFPSLPPFLRRRDSTIPGEPFIQEYKPSKPPIVANTGQESSYLMKKIKREEKFKDNWPDRVGMVDKRTQTKMTTLKNIKVEESDELGRNERRSPDIIDAATPKKSTPRKVVTRTTRGPKRRIEENGLPANSRIFKKLKGNFPKIKFVRKRPSTPTPEQSSEDEKIKTPKTPEFKAPNIKVTGPNLPNNHGRGGRSLRIRGGGGRGGGRGRAGKLVRTATSTSSSAALDPEAEPSCSHSQVETPKKAASKIKTLKPKKLKPVSISRRKSRLKEKEDDDMQVEWNDDEDDAVIMSNKHVPIKKRKIVEEVSNLYSSVGRSEQQQQQFFENGGESHKDLSRYHHHLSPNDSCYSSSLSSTIHYKSPQLSGEETDSASEKGSSSTASRPSGSPNANSPPPRQRQRLKTPLPQLPRISIPPPVFSTSLSTVQKKRAQKQMSVVDSLNLSMPTTLTATASSLSLASSIRRPSLGAGNCVFSNTTAMLARTPGAPGILHQRKVTPHILSNSKIRHFSPTTGTMATSTATATSPIAVVGGSGSGGISSVPVSVSISSTAVSTSNIPPMSSNSTPSPAATAAPPPSSAPATLAQSYPSSSVSVTPLPLTMTALPITTMQGGKVAGAPIIFLQKNASSPPIPISTAPIGIPAATAVIPGKSAPRAVILRRTPLPRPVTGNVMILDVQNKQVLGTAPYMSRTVAVPSDASLTIQEQNTQLVQLPSESSDSDVVYAFSAAPNNLSPRKQKYVASSVSGSECQDQDVGHASDMQLAQIETDLMQMEEEIVYEEEVVTTETENSSMDNEYYKLLLRSQGFEFGID